MIYEFWVEVLFYCWMVSCSIGIFIFKVRYRVVVGVEVGGYDDNCIVEIGFLFVGIY